MDLAGKPRLTVPESLRPLYAPVVEELNEAEDLLRRELSSDNPFVDQLVKHGFRLGGKRLRPALVLLSAQACGGIRPEHVPLAAMAELIHTATLVHDDVLDEATIRRHLDTINARWDNEASILLGDYLFAQAMCLASSLDDNFACRVMCESARRMCEGELRQIEGRGNYGLSETDYFQIIAGKTAALTACCCRLGAHYAGAEPAVCEALARYGHDLGMAFQIADDVLDLSGDEATVGKSLGTDLLKQKATLPLIRLIGHCQSPRIAWNCTRSSPDPGTITGKPWSRGWSDPTQSPTPARKPPGSPAGPEAKLAALPATSACNSLLGLTDFVVTRHQ